MIPNKNTFCIAPWFSVFIDSRKKSGGAYQELLYTIEKIKIENKSKIKFILMDNEKIDTEMIEERSPRHEKSPAQLVEILESTFQKLKNEKLATEITPNNE